MTTDGAAPWPWPDGRRAAISLAYDGGLSAHREVAGPDLDRRDLRGTFYVTPAALVEHAPHWRDCARRGHEIGNGCLMDATLGDGSLPRWTLEMVSLEIDAAEQALREIVPLQPAHSFGYPWGTVRTAEGDDIRGVVDPQVEIARAGTEGFNHPASCDLQYLRCLMADGWNGAELVRLAEEAVRAGVWAVFAFEGIGSGDRSVDRGAHSALLNWLVGVEDQIWIDPVAAVATHVWSTRRRALRLV